MSVIHADSSLAQLFPEGTILWRCCDPLAMVIGQVRIEPFAFEKAKNSEHTVLAKVSVASPHINEPVAIPLSGEDGAMNEGILLFVEGEPPDDWTYLVVTTTSMCLRTSRAQERKGAINAKYGGSLELDDYLRFRAQLLQTRPDEDARFEDKVLHARDVVAGTGMTRCVVDTSGTFPIEYLHFKDCKDAPIVKNHGKDASWKAQGGRADSNVDS